MESNTIETNSAAELGHYILAQLINFPAAPT